MTTAAQGPAGTAPEDAPPLCGFNPGLGHPERQIDPGQAGGDLLGQGDLVRVDVDPDDGPRRPHAPGQRRIGTEQAVPAADFQHPSGRRQSRFDAG